MKSAGVLILFVLTLGMGGCTGSEPKEKPLLVFAAASTAEAVTEVARLFEQGGAGPVQVHCGASSTLARQIEAGAGAQVYLSANPQWMDYLVERGRVDKTSCRPLLANRLVLIQARTEKRSVRDTDVTVVLRQWQGRLALGDPDHVPAGRYARQALQSLGVYASLRNRVLPGSSVRVTLAYVERGEADLGIVYATDARLSSKVEVLGLLPETGHDPIRYLAAALIDAPPSAQAFLAFLTEPRAQSVFVRYGFLPVEEGRE
jgi:molybdate transport system substrate-binding protein